VFVAQEAADGVRGDLARYVSEWTDRFDGISSLNHPCLLRVYGASLPKRPDHRLLVLTEFVPNGVPMSSPQLNATGRVIALISLAKSLNYLHVKGIFHGHLKPSRILVTDGGAKLRVSAFDFDFCDEIGGLSG
jgi:serine/threonine protein kinase